MASAPPPRVVLDLRNSYDSLRQVSNEYLAVLEPPQFRRISVQLRGANTPANNSELPDIPAERVVFLGFSKRNLFWRLRAAWQLRAICREERVDLVIAHRFKSHQVMGLLHFFYPHFAQLAVVHGLNQLAPRARRRFFRGRLRGATVVGVSNAVADDIRHCLAPREHAGSAAQPTPDRVVALYNVIDVATVVGHLLTRDHARQRLGLGADETIIGHIGRLSGSKDQSTLLRAFAVARGELPRARLVIIGEGSKREQLTALVDKLGISTAVTFVGHHEDAWQLMPAFDQFVLTSVEEGFGMVLVEAMVARVPMVVTDAGGIREVVGDCTSLCKPGDVKAIASEMVRISRLTYDQKSELGAKLFRRVEAEFGRDGMRQRLPKLVESLLR